MGHSKVLVYCLHFWYQANWETFPLLPLAFPDDHKLFSPHHYPPKSYPDLTIFVSMQPPVPYLLFLSLDASPFLFSVSDYSVSIFHLYKACSRHQKRKVHLVHSLTLLSISQLSQLSLSHLSKPQSLSSQSQKPCLSLVTQQFPHRLNNVPPSSLLFPLSSPSFPLLFYQYHLLLLCQTL